MQNINNRFHSDKLNEAFKNNHDKIELEMELLKQIQEDIKEMERYFTAVGNDFFKWSPVDNIEGERFSLIWNPDSRRIQYNSFEIESRNLVETKKEIRKKVYKYLPQFFQLYTDYIFKRDEESL